LVCLDTSVLVPLLRKEEHALSVLRDAADKGAKVSTTVVSLCELYAGAYASEDEPKEKPDVDQSVGYLASGHYLPRRIPRRLRGVRLKLALDS
jgi:predicted nucleic acid-binding protein